VYFLYREEDEATVIPKALDLIDLRLHHDGHTLIVPGEAKVGWNWKSAYTQTDADADRAKGRIPLPLNPLGLKKWKAPAKA